MFLYAKLKPNSYDYHIYQGKKAHLQGDLASNTRKNFRLNGTF